MPKSASGNKVTRPVSSGKPHQWFSFGSDGGDGVQLVFFSFIVHVLIFLFQPQTVQTLFTPFWDQPQTVQDNFYMLLGRFRIFFPLHYRLSKTVFTHFWIFFR